MPPNHEIRTLVDSTVAFFNEKSDRPLTYQVNVSFYGGPKDTQRLSEHVLDLTAYKGLSWITRRGLHELTNEVEKISRNTERIGKELSELNEYLTEGVHIRNAVLTSTILQSDEGSWQRMVSSKLLEFKHLWLSMYQGNLDKLLQPFLGKLRNRLIQLADQLLVMISTSPPGVDDKIKDVLLVIVGKLADLDAMRFYIDSGNSAKQFDTQGDEILKLVDDAIASLEISSTRADG